MASVLPPWVKPDEGEAGVHQRNHTYFLRGHSWSAYFPTQAELFEPNVMTIRDIKELSCSNKTQEHETRGQGFKLLPTLQKLFFPAHLNKVYIPVMSYK